MLSQVSFFYVLMYQFPKRLSTYRERKRQELWHAGNKVEVRQTEDQETMVTSTKLLLITTCSREHEQRHEFIACREPGQTEA